MSDHTVATASRHWFAASAVMHPPRSHPATLLKIYSTVAIGRRTGGRSAVQELKVR